MTVDFDLMAVPVHNTGESSDPAASGVGEMPHSIEAEQALLGGLLSSNRLLDQLDDRLSPDHFFHPAHARIFTAIKHLINEGRLADPKTLATYFEADDDLRPVGGPRYLDDLVAARVVGITARDYAAHLIDLHMRRRLIEIGEDLAYEARHADPGVSAADQLGIAETQLYNLATAGEAERSDTALGDAVRMAIQTAEAAYQRDSGITGVTTGFESLNKTLGGLHKSDLLILAGRPSMGKTALATNMGFRAAQAYLDSNGTDGGQVLIFSLEMSAEQLAMRILSEITRIPSDKIRRGELRDQDFPAFVQASRDLAAMPMYIDDTPALSVSQVRQRARKIKRTKGLDLVIIDYLQLLRGSGSGAAAENRVLEVSEITRGLKALAKELDVPVLALSQLSRAVEQREDKRPQLADLRESGSIEQDADVVMFVYREEYYLSRAEPAQRADEAQERFNERYERWRQRAEEAHNIAEVIIAKQRHGPIGAPKLFFDGMYTRFDDLDTKHGAA